MREIKFRAWVPEAESFIYTDDLTVVIDNQTILLWGCGEWSKHKVECVQQFTGLKDKNGKEIYEGDIVETVTASGNPFGTIDVVRYQDGGFKLVDDTDSLLPIYIGDKEVISIEIIGNIYEDKHLLDGDK